jgi:hypothetical protein
VVKHRDASRGGPNPSRDEGPRRRPPS